MRHLSHHDMYAHVFFSKLNPQMNSQMMHCSSYWKCSNSHPQRQDRVQTFYACLHRVKAIAAVLKDAISFIPLNAVNANMLASLHRGKQRRRSLLQPSTA